MERMAEMIETALIQALQKHDRPNPEKLYTRSQAARLMGKKYDTIDRMILQKRIQATSDGKYISQRAIDNYIDGEK
jgi:hypothetical protein